MLHFSEECNTKCNTKSVTKKPDEEHIAASLPGSLYALA